MSYDCRNILHKVTITLKERCYKIRQWDKSIVKYMVVTIKDKQILPCNKANRMAHIRLDSTYGDS